MNFFRLVALSAVLLASAFGQWLPPGGGAGGGGSGTGTVTTITLVGTANQITVTGTCTVTTSGTCTFSIPSDFRLPGTINKLTLTQPATGATVTIADGKTLTVNNSVIFTGTDGSTLTFGTGGTLTYTSNNLSVFAATTSAQLAGVLTDETGTGFVVYSASPALSGAPTAPTPAATDNSTTIATTAYVTTGITNAINAAAGRDLVTAASNAVLPNTPTYNNGVSGIGATLTSGSNVALVVDGYTCILNDRILVKNQGSALQNGIYYCSQVGTGILPWILTRALDYDTPSDINNTTVPVANHGTVNPLTSWIQTATVATVGTDSIVFAAFTPAGANIVTSASPGLGFCHFAGSTQNCTSVELSAANAQTGTYQVLAADFSAYKTITVASGTFTITLVASGSQPPAGEFLKIINYGSGVVTIARSGQNINGGTASLTLPAASATAPSSSYVFSDGTNYFASLEEVPASTTCTTQFVRAVNGTAAATCATIATADIPASVTLTPGSGPGTTSTSATAFVTVGASATQIPGMVAGDALHVQFTGNHTGGTTNNWFFQFAAGTNNIFNGRENTATDVYESCDAWIINTAASTQLIYGMCFRPNGSWFNLDFNSGGNFVAGTADLSSAFTFNLRMRMETGGAESITAANWSVIFVPKR